MTPPNPALAKRLEGLNRFLSAVHVQETRLSDILETNGFTENQIKELRCGDVEAFLDDVCFAIRCVLERYHCGACMAEASRRFYGYGNTPPQPVSVVSAETGMSRDEVTDFVARSHKRLGHSRGRTLLAAAICCAAEKRLGIWRRRIKATPHGLEDDSSQEDTD